MARSIVSSTCGKKKQCQNVFQLGSCDSCIIAGLVNELRKRDIVMVLTANFVYSGFCVFNSSRAVVVVWWAREAVSPLVTFHVCVNVQLSRIMMNSLYSCHHH